MQRVLVVDKNRKPLMSCQPARARELLKKGKAKVLLSYPFTIILTERKDGETQESQIKFDPGAKTTGIAIVSKFARGLVCIWAAELNHRGFNIRDSLIRRSQLRRSRRSRKTRYRASRFYNRRRTPGWIAPSLMSRVSNISTWLKRLRKLIPISHIALELVRFDTQALENPEISGVEYQQGELLGYEIREYLLEKWGRSCAYCGKTNTPLEIEHVIPKSRGGSNQVSNLTLACRGCNLKKADKTASEFGYPLIQQNAKKSLNSATVINITRWVLFEALKRQNLPLEVGTGGRTKFNRRQQDYTKTHWIDAACVGKSGEIVFIYPAHRPLIISAVGHGSRQICGTDKYGFPTRHRHRRKRHFGFQTGDIVEANVLRGKHAGKHLGRVSCRARGSFDIQGRMRNALSVSHKVCRLIHHADGYSYYIFQC